MFTFSSLEHSIKCTDTHTYTQRLAPKFLEEIFAIFFPTIESLSSFAETEATYEWRLFVPDYIEYERKSLRVYCIASQQLMLVRTAARSYGQVQFSCSTISNSGDILTHNFGETQIE